MGYAIKKPLGQTTMRTHAHLGIAAACQILMTVNEPKPHQMAAIPQTTSNLSHWQDSPPDRASMPVSLPFAARSLFPFHSVKASSPSLCKRNDSYKHWDHPNDFRDWTIRQKPCHYARRNATVSASHSHRPAFGEGVQRRNMPSTARGIWKRRTVVVPEQEQHNDDGDQTSHSEALERSYCMSEAMLD